MDAGHPADRRGTAAASGVAAPALVVATSGRLIAESLVAAGIPTDVLDSFADQDCAAVARTVRALPWTAADDPAPEGDAVLTAVAHWAVRHPDGRLILGAGFEHRPELVDRLAACLPLAGSPPAVWRRCKDPWTLAAACQMLGLASPELMQPWKATVRALPGRGWLAKRSGGCGGGHVRPPGPLDADEHAIYWQRRIPGLPVAILFHAHARGTVPLSFHVQFCAATPVQPWRFGGVLAVPGVPDPPGGRWQGPLETAAQALSRHFGLRGLNSLDAIWDGTTLWVLEINPRPPASLALLPLPSRAAALRAHHGLLNDAASPHFRQDPTTADLAEGPAGMHALNGGMAVVYASARLPIPADFRFPPGCHDIPRLPHVFGPGEAVCSMQVSTGGIEKLRSLHGLLRERLLPLAGAEVLSSL